MSPSDSGIPTETTASFSSSSTPPSPIQLGAEQPPRRTSFIAETLTARSRRQLSLFFAGATFFALSSVITRRSLIRRRKAGIPAFYHPNPNTYLQLRSHNEVNGAVEAFEALNIASVNVVSLSFMLTGGLLWAMDISSLEDLRRRVRGLGLLVDEHGREISDQTHGLHDAQRIKDADEELEEWIATILARKEDKDRRKKDAG